MGAGGMYNMSGSTPKKGILTGLGAVLGGPVGGLVGSLASSLLGNRGAKSRQRLADQQNIKFWNMQNAYNTPKEQMKRLQDAGLNPNLIYGSNANTGTAGSVAPSKASPYSVQNPVPSAVQTALIGSQIANLNSITAKNDADQERIKADTAKTLGLTPSLVQRSEKQLEILVEQKFQQAVKSGQITKQEQARTMELMAKSETAVINEGYQKAYTNFKKGLLRTGIDPQGGLHTTLLKWFGTLLGKFQSKAGKAPDQHFLSNYYKNKN